MRAEKLRAVHPGQHFTMFFLLADMIPFVIQLQGRHKLIICLFPNGISFVEAFQMGRSPHWHITLHEIVSMHFRLVLREIWLF